MLWQRVGKKSHAGVHLRSTLEKWPSEETDQSPACWDPMSVKLTKMKGSIQLEFPLAFLCLMFVRFTVQDHRISRGRTTAT